MTIVKMNVCRKKNNIWIQNNHLRVSIIDKILFLIIRKDIFNL